MQQFKQRIRLFLLPLVILAVLMYLGPLDKLFAYRYLHDDCDNRGGWMSGKLPEKENTDMLFLGSSHTITGIIDSLVSAKLSDSIQTFHALNYGYCRLGNNLLYALFKDYAALHHPKKLIIEVREDEALGSHPVFPFIADLNDLVIQPHWANQQYFSDIYQSGLMRLDYYRENLLGTKQDRSIPASHYGFRPSDDMADSAWMEKAKYDRQHAGKSRVPFRETNINWSLSWIRQLAELARHEHISVYFLYIPSYGSPEAEPAQAAEYRKLGTLLIPDRKIFDNWKNWRDDAHLNTNGARELTEWFCREIQKTQQ